MREEAEEEVEAEGAEAAEEIVVGGGDRAVDESRRGVGLEDGGEWNCGAEVDAEAEAEAEGESGPCDLALLSPAGAAVPLALSSWEGRGTSQLSQR